MSREKLARVLRKNAVKSSGGCLPVLLGLALMAALWWPPGVVQAAHWSRGNGASAVQPQETGVSPQANAPAGATIPAPVQPGAAPDCDNSQLTVVAACQPGGALQVTVKNVGERMRGATAWRFTAGGQVQTHGALQLGAGDVAVLNALPTTLTVTFTIEQRPGVLPAVVTSTQVCTPTPTAVQMAGLAATGADWATGVAGALVLGLAALLGGMLVVARRRLPPA